MATHRYPIRIDTNVTPDMDARLEDLRARLARNGHKMSKAELLRQALRALLESDAGSAGSRANVGQGVERRLADLGAHVERLEKRMVDTADSIQVLFDDQGAVCAAHRPGTRPTSHA